MKFACGSREVLLILAFAGLAALGIPFVLRWQEPAPPPKGLPASVAPPSPPAPPPPVATPDPAPVDPFPAWRDSIRRRDERGVLGGQSVFLSREAEYREALARMSTEDEEPRVRAFSIAVLGRMKSPPPEGFFLGRLADTHEFPRTSALQALEKVGTSACLPYVDQRAESDPAQGVRAAASKAAKAIRSR
jgi:hypothetical protein